MIAWFQAHWMVISGVIIALDTALAEIPAFKANSTFQLVSGIVLKLLGKSPQS